MTEPQTLGRKILMQHLAPGALVAVRVDGLHFYFLILSRSAFFGCQWARGFHFTSEDVKDAKTVLDTADSGFTALVDFIDFRRGNEVLKLSRKNEVSRFLDFEFTRNRIDEYNGPTLWYIYARNWSIVEKRETLEPWQRSLPMGTGMKARDALKLVRKKYRNDHVQATRGTPKFPIEE